MSVWLRPYPASSGNRHYPSSNTAAVVTKAAVPGYAHVVGSVAWSYDAAPTGGNLKIEDVSGTTVFSIDITAAGPGVFNFFPPLKMAAANTALIVTLAAGGSGVTGKLSVHCTTMP